VVRALQWHPRMTNALLYDALPVALAPASSTIVTIDGSALVFLLAVALSIGVLVAMAHRSPERRRRPSTPPVWDAHVAAQRP
jgi:hypothetical protein